MGDAELAAPAELPRTGVPPEAKHKMSATFVAPWQHPVRPGMCLWCSERLPWGMVESVTMYSSFFNTSAEHTSMAPRRGTR